MRCEDGAHVGRQDACAGTRIQPGIKFGNGNVTAIDGNKITIAFDKAGETRVVDSFVERV